ncbi:MAG TPA: hypothetical protein VK541_08470 [Pedobacter sp.]|uniref:hypothetical protein n=1 Tax=Pedobacter sp. TaxID=1411316 RepID=UPI002CD3B27B|nr:hypothetical protein [Pedobacter sp.]HMI02500.1 hypothetical protein [Pedobacter sp.]
MSKANNNVSKDSTSDGFSYLTKRTLVAKAKSAGKFAAKNAMETMGYVVAVKDGWLVKQYSNGDIEKVSEVGSK